MRHLLRVVVALSAVPLATVSASSNRLASDSTDCRPSGGESQTLAQSVGLNGMHYDRSTDLRFVDGGGGEIVQQRLMLSFCKAPTISLGLAAGRGENMNFVSGEPLALTRLDPHGAAISFFGGEMQWRTGDPGVLNAVFSAALGRVTTNWYYTYLVPPAGAVRPTNTASSGAYGSLGVGYELKVFKYLRIGLMGGVRFQSPLTTPGLEAKPLQGPFLGGNFGFGMF